MDSIQNGYGIVVSDLHLGQWGTTGLRALKTVDDKIDALKPSLIVLNSDIIEGGDVYGDHADIHASIAKGINRLRSLIHHAVEANPNCKLVYIYGNHDSFREVQDRLDQLKAEVGIEGHLQLEESLFRCRDALFLHGDLQVEHDGRWRSLLTGTQMKPGTALTRPEHGGSSGWKTATPMTGVNGAVKQCFVAGLSIFDQEISPVTFPLKEYTRNILSCLDQHDPKLLDGVTRVLMGHVHAPYGQNYMHPRGIQFLVTGPATAKSNNTMYQFKIADRGLMNFEIFSDHKPWFGR